MLLIFLQQCHKSGFLLEMLSQTRRERLRVDITFNNHQCANKHQSRRKEDTNSPYEKGDLNPKWHGTIMAPKCSSLHPAPP